MIIDYVTIESIKKNPIINGFWWKVHQIVQNEKLTDNIESNFSIWLIVCKIWAKRLIRTIT